MDVSCNEAYVDVSCNEAYVDVSCNEAYVDVSCNDAYVDVSCNVFAEHQLLKILGSCISLIRNQQWGKWAATKRFQAKWHKSFIFQVP